MSLAKTLDMEALMMSPILAVLTFVAWIILGLGIIKVGLPFETLLPLFLVMAAVNIVYVGTLSPRLSRPQDRACCHTWVSCWQRIHTRRSSRSPTLQR